MFPLSVSLIRELRNELGKKLDKFLEFGRKTKLMSYQSWSLLNRGRWRKGRKKVLYLELRFGTVTRLSKEDQQAIVWSKVQVLKETGKLSNEDL